jgi:O-antigen ligase
MAIHVKKDPLMTIICALIISCPLVMVFAGRFIEVIVPVTGLFILAYFYKTKQIKMQMGLLKAALKKPISLCLMLLIAIIMVNAYRGQMPHKELLGATIICLELLFVMLVGYFLVRFAPQDFPNYFLNITLIAAISLFILVVLIEYTSWISPKIMQMHLFKRVELAVALWLFPVIYLTPGQYFKHIMIAFLLVISSIIGDGKTAIAILGLSVFIFSIAKFFPKHMLKILLATLIISLLFAPFIYHLAEVLFGGYLRAKPTINSTLHRMMIWEAYSHLALMKPFFGWGFDFARYAEKIPETLAIIQGKNIGFGMHPHQQQLQIWLELGLIGIITTCFTLFYAFKSRLNLSFHKTPYVAASLIGTLFMVSMNFSLWQPWIIAVVGLQLMLLAMNPHRSGQAPVKSQGRPRHIARKRRHKKRR